MSNFMGTDIQEYRWKPYPSKKFEEEKASELSSDEIYKLPEHKRKEIQTLKADYVGKLQIHRADNRTNYNFLNENIRKFFTQGKNQEGIKEVEKLLNDHKTKERTVDSLHHNEVFKSLGYAG